MSGVKPRPVVIIGRGKMGLALSKSLRHARVSHRVVSARSQKECSLRAKGRRETVFVLAVTDRFIEDTVKWLLPRVETRDLVFHLAGMLGPEVLGALRATGCAVAALHPLVAVSAKVPPGELSERPAFVVEGDRRATGVARGLVKSIGGRCITARAVDRAGYHSAAALIATGAAALSYGAAMGFRTALVPAPSARDERAMIASLLRSVARNVENYGPEAALASPLLRGDTLTVERHLEALDRVGAGGLYAAALGLVLQCAENAKTVTQETVVAARELLKRYE